MSAADHLRDAIAEGCTRDDHDHVADHRAEVLAEVANPADAATIYAVRPCVCDDTPHPTWCPASVPTDKRIAEIRQGIGAPLTPRELSWLTGAAGRHELHVIGARGGHWPMTDDLPGALLLVSQYLAAAVAVIERARLVEAAPSPDDVEWIRCSRSHCPNAERFTVAPKRGWQHGHMDTWLCPEHRTNGGKDTHPGESAQLAGHQLAGAILNDVTEGGGGRG